MRTWRKIGLVASAAAMMIGLLGSSSGAAPAGYRGKIRERKVVQVFAVEPTPACPIDAGTVTAVETAVGHLVAELDRGDPGDPDDDVLVPPARLHLNLTARVTLEPDDASRPTYEGHSGMHYAWRVGPDGTGVARVERAIVLKAEDGSRHSLHLVGRAVFDLGQVGSDNEGLVEITMEKLRCGG